MRHALAALSPRPLLLFGLLILAACSGADENALAELDNDLLANGTDPALTSALEDQILADPNLVQQANPNTVRPPETPVQAQYPAGSARAEAALASMQRAGAESGATSQQPSSTQARPCNGAAAFDHDRRWAQRLPAEFPLYPGARVTDAAGADAEHCRMRVITFTTADSWQRVIDHYRRTARRSGFTAEHQQRGRDHVLGGVRADTDGAFYLIVTPQANSSDVALIVNNGR